MILTNYEQLNLLIQSIFVGFFTGVIFDIYRVLRGEGPKHKIISFIEDLLFWILVAILIFAFLLWETGAIINIYVFFFIGIGVYLYAMFCSGRIVKYYRTIFLNLFKSIRIISKLLIYPFKILKYVLFKNKNN